MFGGQLDGVGREENGTWERKTHFLENQIKCTTKFTQIFKKL